MHQYVQHSSADVDHLNVSYVSEGRSSVNEHENVSESDQRSDIKTDC